MKMMTTQKTRKKRRELGSGGWCWPQRRDAVRHRPRLGGCVILGSGGEERKRMMNHHKPAAADHGG